MTRSTILRSIKRSYAKGTSHLYDLYEVLPTKLSDNIALLKFLAAPTELQKKAEIKKRVVLEKFRRKAVRVAILGACTPTGESLALLLKANPLVSHLYLQGDAARGVAADLAHIDTRTMVTGYYENDVDKAVRV